MQYTILTLGNPEREGYRREIRQQLSNYEEIVVESVDGKDVGQLNSNIEKYGFRINFPVWRPGEGGVWYSNINAWTYAAETETDLLVFEDDAILGAEFGMEVSSLTLPNEYDFVTLYIPFKNKLQVAPFRLGPVAQEHGNVCILYSSQGAKRILEILEDEGLEWPVDIWLFKKALVGKLKGYGPKATSRRIVDVDLDIPTNIHNDDRINVWSPSAV